MRADHEVQAQFRILLAAKKTHHIHNQQYKNNPPEQVV
jgi:hypothetical protein